MRVRSFVAATMAVALAGCASTSASSSRTPATTQVTPDSAFARLAETGDSIAIAHAVAQDCAKSANRGDCYQAFLVVPASHGRVRIAMGALDVLGSQDADVRREGHVFAHAIGITAGKGKTDIAQPFKECNEAFQSGCYHGIIQAWFAPLDSISARDANALCEPFRKDERDRWIRFQCVHGMGHGLTMLHGHDLNKALAGCDLLTEWWDRHSCYSGAFMENIVNVTMPHHPASELAHHEDMSGMDHDMAGMDHDMAGMDHSHTTFKAIDPNDQQYPCSVMPDRYLSACYEMQTSVMLYNNHGDIAGAARECDKAPQAYRTTCFASLGRDISSYSAQNHTEAIRMCGYASAKYEPWCFYGVVKNFIDLDARASSGLSLCRDIKDVSSKYVCYSAVGEQVMVLAADETARRSMCASAEADYLDACLYGARVTGVAAPAKLVEVWGTAR
jgi:hypothetical protein